MWIEGSCSVFSFFLTWQKLEFNDRKGLQRKRVNDTIKSKLLIEGDFFFQLSYNLHLVKYTAISE